MCSSRSVIWSIVSQTQSPLQEGCIQFYYSSNPSYNERYSEKKSKNVVFVLKYEGSLSYIIKERCPLRFNHLTLEFLQSTVLVTL